MSEGEILFRAGHPDREVYFDTEGQRTIESIKQLFYIPGTEETDPHVTVITIQAGRAIDIERIKLFSPLSTSKGGQIDTESFIRLKIGMSEAEVLARVGLPDKEEFLGGDPHVPNDAINLLFYIPEAEELDPHVTIITVSRGRVVRLERTKLLFK